MWEQHVEWGCMRGPDMCPFKKQLMSITCQKQFQPFGEYPWKKRIAVKAIVGLTC